MKKNVLLLLILLLGFVLSGCSATDGHQDTPEDIVSPVNLTMEILVGLPSATEDGFENVEATDFIAEDGANVLEATQLFCMANDLTISLDGDNAYVTEINGLTEKDYNENTGWIFKVNGEMGSLGANEEIVQEGDTITWEFVDFSNYSW